jgi:hypothetical protein
MQPETIEEVRSWIVKAVLQPTESETTRAIELAEELMCFIVSQLPIEARQGD